MTADGANQRLTWSRGPGCHTDERHCSQSVASSLSLSPLALPHSACDDEAKQQQRFFYEMFPSVNNHGSSLGPPVSTCEKHTASLVFMTAAVEHEKESYRLSIQPAFVPPTSCSLSLCSAINPNL